MAITCTFTSSGYSDIVTGTEIIYFVDFDSSGIGTAQLECLVDGTWLPADVQYSGSMIAARCTDLLHVGERSFRWRVTRTGGTIVTYLDKN